MTRNALVLGGGGARGSYEIGVWKGLMDLGWDIHVVTGTSVGALNGALIAQQNDAVAEELWLNITTSQIIATEDVKNIDAAMGLLKTAEAYLKTLPKEEIGLNTDPLGELLEQYVDETTLRNSDVDFGIVTLLMDPPRLVPKQMFMDDIPKGQLIDYLWASSSLYPVLKAHKIDGKIYIDGGAYDNLPVELALTRNVDEIVAVDLNAIGFCRKYKLKTGQKITNIKPFWDLGPLFYFSGESSKRNMRLGYLDTQKAFQKQKGCYYTFPREAFTAPKKEEEQRLSALQSSIPFENNDFSEAFIQKKFRRCLTEETDLWLIAAECAGEIFEVSPLEIYTEKTFKNAVKAKIKSYTVKQKVMDGFGFHKILTLKKKLQSLDSKGKVATLTKIMQKKEDAPLPRALGALTHVFPAEFLAAAYLWMEEITIE